MQSWFSEFHTPDGKVWFGKHPSALLKRGATDQRMTF